jgi:hypothetical protein
MNPNYKTTINMQKMMLMTAAVDDEALVRDA